MKPLIATICGSYRFSETMIEVYRKLTDCGYAVFLPAIGCNERDKEWYMDLHFKKIEMSDIVFIVDVGYGKEAVRTPSYIGQSTRQEIEHALKNGKTVLYLSK